MFFQNRFVFQNRFIVIFSLAPGFSPVICGDPAVQPLQRLSEDRESR
jgi:hypothetical protein